nr:MAG TPA: hypothetical protein [Caudoviricetes sp.]
MSLIAILYFVLSQMMIYVLILYSISHVLA